MLHLLCADRPALVIRGNEKQRGVSHPSIGRAYTCRVHADHAWAERRHGVQHLYIDREPDTRLHRICRPPRCGTFGNLPLVRIHSTVQQETTPPITPVEEAEPHFGCSMLTRIRELPWGLQYRPQSRCSLGFALHDDSEVAQCRAVDGPAACWKATANWRVAPAPGPGPRGERPTTESETSDGTSPALAAATGEATVVEGQADSQPSTSASRREERRQRAAAVRAARRTTDGGTADPELASDLAGSDLATDATAPAPTPDGPRRSPRSRSRRRSEVAEGTEQGATSEDIGGVDLGASPAAPDAADATETTAAAEKRERARNVPPPRQGAFAPLGGPRPDETPATPPTAPVLTAAPPLEPEWSPAEGAPAAEPSADLATSMATAQSTPSEVAPSEPPESPAASHSAQPDAHPENAGDASNAASTAPSELPAESSTTPSETRSENSSDAPSDEREHNLP